MSTEPIGFVAIGPGDGHRMVVGGLTVLERALRDLHGRGVTKVQVPAAPADLPPALSSSMRIEWVPPGTPAPPDAVTVPGDQVMGLRVHDEPSRQQAEWALCKSLSKSHQGPIDALFNWRFSMPITRRLAYTRVTPNQITFAGILVGLAACLSVSRGDWAAIALGGLLLQLHSVLDSCDGELARLRFQFSRYGQWFDNLSDDLVDNLFIVAAGYAAGGAFFPLALLGAGGRLGTNLFVYIDVYRRTGTGDLYAFRLWFEREKRAVVDVYDPRHWLTWVRAVGRRDTYVFAWMLLALANLPAGVAVWAAVLGVAEGAVILVHVSFRLAELSGLRRAP